MGWPSDEDDGDGKATAARLGSLVQLVVAGAVLLTVVGVGPLENAIERLGSTASTASVTSPIAISPDLGLTLLAVAVGVLLVVTGLAVGAWYRLPDPPA